MLNFSDGMKFDTRGEYRYEHRSDGWYVVGHGWLIAADSLESALAAVEKLQDKEKKNKGIEK